MSLLNEDLNEWLKDLANMLSAYLLFCLKVLRFRYRGLVCSLDYAVGGSLDVVINDDLTNRANLDMA